MCCYVDFFVRKAHLHFAFRSVFSHRTEGNRYQLIFFSSRTILRYANVLIDPSTTQDRL
jgi:hypothetical protein